MSLPNASSGQPTIILVPFFWKSIVKLLEMISQVLHPEQYAAHVAQRRGWPELLHSVPGEPRVGILEVQPQGCEDCDQPDVEKHGLRINLLIKERKKERKKQTNKQTKKKRNKERNKVLKKERKNKRKKKKYFLTQKTSTNNSSYC